MEYIGFTTKYYTLWNVEVRGNYTYYDYKQNLSMDFEKAKAKRPNALIDLSLRGHSSFRVENTIPHDCFLFGKFKNQPLAEHKDEIDYMAWYYNHLSAESYKSKAKQMLEENGYKELNGKMYNDADYKRMSFLMEHFPTFDAKIKNNEVFRFIPTKNLRKGYDENENEVAIMDIPFCHLVFSDFEEKEYNGFNYCLPISNGITYRIKGAKVVVDNYVATKIDDITYDIKILHFYVEY